MVLSMHSHSGEYCLHAHGTLKESIDQAISMGFKVYGLSEHMPRSRPADLYPEEYHLSTEDLVEFYRKFVKEARSLQALYAERITLLVGLETEWIHSETVQEVLQLQKDYRLDYIVSEFPIDYDEHHYQQAEAFLQTDNESGTEILFQAYFDAQFDMLKSLKPMVVGHFDLIRLFRPNFHLSPQVWQKIKRNIEFISQYGGLVEINSRAFKKGLQSPYPGRDILQVMMQEYPRIRFTLSDDSHGYKDIGMHYDKLFAYLQEMNVRTIYYPQRDPKTGEMEIVPWKSFLEDPFWTSSFRLSIGNIHNPDPLRGQSVDEE